VANSFFDGPMTELVEVGRYRTLAHAEQRALVLTAAGIECRVEPSSEAVVLLVSFMEAERARSELASFEIENVPDRKGLPSARAGAWGVEAALAYAAVLLFFFGADNKGAFSVDWQGLGAAQAGLIVEGAWWRTLTALTLHSGSVHLISNLAVGIIFGLLASQSLGAGVGWLAMVAAGALGNGLNAVIQSSAHTAIGASTGVFGVLGVLSGYTLKSRAVRWRSRIRRWSPIAAGIMLLAFFGMGGEQTDIWAHVAGFGVGAGMGFALAHVKQDALQGSKVQWISGAVACCLIAVAWAFALWR
jgi:membrane associated rhomboid family serine protease